MILREPCKLSGADGLIVITIDGVERKFQVRIRESNGPERIVRFNEHSHSLQLMQHKDDHPPF